MRPSDADFKGPTGESGEGGKGVCQEGWITCRAMCAHLAMCVAFWLSEHELHSKMLDFLFPPFAQVLQVLAVLEIIIIEHLSCMLSADFFIHLLNQTRLLYSMISLCFILLYIFFWFFVFVLFLSFASCEVATLNGLLVQRGPPKVHLAAIIFILYLILQSLWIYLYTFTLQSDILKNMTD